MSKQTAVQLLKESIDRELKLGTKMVVNWDMYLAMEKEQIIEAHGFEREHDIQFGLDFWKVHHGEAYYNETYGGDK